MMASADNHKAKAALRRRVLAQEPDYYIRLLFTRNSWKQVLMTSLEVTEVILGVLVLLAGLYLWRSGRTLASMVSILVGLLPWLGLTLVLSLGAAALAKAAESRRRSGRALSLLPFCFLGLIVLPLMVSQLLHRLTALPVPLDTQSNPVFTPAPILLPGMFWGIVLVTGLLVYLAWALWWRALLWALETRGEVDIWSIIAETQVPRRRRALSDNSSVSSDSSRRSCANGSLGKGESAKTCCPGPPKPVPTSKKPTLGPRVWTAFPGPVPHVGSRRRLGVQIVRWACLSLEQVGLGTKLYS